MSEKKTIAIVAGAGSGRRLGLAAKKPFVMLGGRPIITYCLAVLGASKIIDEIIVAVDESCIGRMRRLIPRYHLKKIRDVVRGGASRFESVRNCLERLDPSCGIVLIHDAARPFLEEGLIRGTIASAKRFGASIAAVPEQDTIKSVKGGLFISNTVDRSRIWRAQTPQVFRRSLIVEAYANAPRDSSKITDDSCLIERLGKKVRIASGSYKNIKITTKEDLTLARKLIR